MPRINRTKLCAWFAAQGPALVLFARQCLSGGDRETANDIVQEVFVRLLARTDDTGGIAEPPNPAAWLHRCVRNACLDERRTRRRRASRERRVAAERSEWFDPQPHDLIDIADARQLVESLDDLPRQILVLRIWSALTLAEIAEVVSLPVSTVHDHYRKALAKLRAAMESKEKAMSEPLPDVDAASTPADRELEAALHSLRPAGAAINPVDALFEAGRLAGSEYAKWRLFAWRGVAAVMAIVLAVMVVYQPKPVEIEHVRLVSVAPAESTRELPLEAATDDRAIEPRLTAESMLAMRQVAMERGVDHLPSLPGGHLQITHLRDPAIP